MTARFPLLLLAAALALAPVSAYTLSGLCAPIFDWWWTPRWKALFFLLVLDVLLAAAGCPLLLWTLLQGSSADAGEANRPRRLTSAAWLAGILALSGITTLRCTRASCVQLTDRADAHYARGERERGDRLLDQARRRCLAAGHDPAH